MTKKKINGQKIVLDLPVVEEITAEGFINGEIFEHKLISCFEDAHEALVEAAKIAHLVKHPEAQAISKLIDSLEEIDARVWARLRNTSES